jgi:hypothetical protein
MRAMEAAVQKLRGRVGVTITPQTTWRQLTGNMEDEIKKMPDKTERQQRKPEGQIFGVTAAQLSQTTFVAGQGGTDDLLVGATDGHVFSGWSGLHIQV